jgi:hypothetical protein
LPLPRQPQGNYPGAQLCNFDCCLKRPDRIGLVISSQSLGNCSAAFVGKNSQRRGGK